MYVVRRVLRSGKRPGVNIMPAATVLELAVKSFAARATSHGEQANRLVAIHAVVDSFEPPVEPAQAVAVVVIEYRVGAEIDVAGEGLFPAAVGPWTHEQVLACLQLL